MKHPIIKMLTLITILGICFNASGSNNTLFEANDWATLNHLTHHQTTATMDSERMALGTINTDRLSNAHVNDVLTLVTPGDGHQLNLYINHIDNNIGGIKTFSGTIDGYPKSNFTMSYEGDRILGNLQYNGYSYIIKPSAEVKGQHLLYRGIFSSNNHFHPSHTHDHNHPHAHNSDHAHQLKDNAQSENKSQYGEKPGQVTTHDVKVLFLYANNVLNANLQASNVVTKFNQVLQNSQVGTNDAANQYIISAAGEAQLIDDDFDLVSREDILRLMENKTGILSDVDIRRDNVGADLVFLFITPQIEGSLERVGGAAFTLLPQLPYAVSTDDYALGDLTAIHEIGHMLGGQHQDLLPPNDTIPTPGLLPGETRNHGLEDVNGQWQTIMGGYNFACQLDSSIAPEMQDCSRIEYFSNPDLTPIVTGGQTIGDLQTADMQSVLEITMPMVANWGSLTPSVYNEPIRGYSFDPKKNGHGLHITKAGSGTNTQYVIVFYTYQNNGQPEWMIAQTTDYNNNVLTGTFNRHTFDYTTEQTTAHFAGSFTLDYSVTSVNNATACDGVNRSLQPGVFNWTIDGQTDTWCMRPLFANSDFVPFIPDAASKSGLWYESAYSGWGISFQTAPSGSGNVALATSYYYDNNGIGRWANGQLNNVPLIQSDFVFNLFNHVTGYPRTGTGVTTTQDIGTFKILFSNGNRSYIKATYPIPLNTMPPTPQQPWMRPEAGAGTDVLISRLSY